MFLILAACAALHRAEDDHEEIFPLGTYVRTYVCDAGTDAVLVSQIICSFQNRYESSYDQYNCTCI